MSQTESNEYFFEFSFLDQLFEKQFEAFLKFGILFVDSTCGLYLWIILVDYTCGFCFSVLKGVHNFEELLE